MSYQNEFIPAKQAIETLREPSENGELWVADTLQEFLAVSYGFEHALADRFNCDRRDTGAPIASYSFGSTGEIAVKNYLRNFSTVPNTIFTQFEVTEDKTVTRHIVPGVAVGTKSKAVETAFSFSGLEGVEARRKVLKLGRQAVGCGRGQVIRNPFEEQVKAGFSDIKLPDNALRRGLRAGHFRTI